MKMLMNRNKKYLDNLNRKSSLFLMQISLDGDKNRKNNLLFKISSTKDIEFYLSTCRFFSFVSRVITIKSFS